MKPVRFKYFAPETVAEAVARLEEYGDEAKVLAGGQSLVPLMNLRLARPGVLVDICRIPRLDEIRRNGSLSIGATARQRAVRQSDEVAAAAPIITEVMRWVGHPATQSQGTFGGMAAHADPAAEIPAVLLALDAELVATGRDGERAIPAGEFFSTWFTTTLAPHRDPHRGSDSCLGEPEPECLPRVGPTARRLRDGWRCSGGGARRGGHSRVVAPYPVRRGRHARSRARLGGVPRRQATGLGDDAGGRPNGGRRPEPTV